MNQAAYLVASSLSNNRIKTLMLGDNAFTFRPLTIRKICMVMEEFAKVDEPENFKEAFLNISEHSLNIARGISKAISDDWKPIYEQLKDCTEGELEIAQQVVFEMIGAESFFRCAHSVARGAQMIARPK